MSEIKILKIEPGEEPTVIKIKNDLKSMQGIVDGYIEAVYPFDDPIALICNEEGKINNLKLNRALRNPDTGEISDIIAGTFFIAFAPPNTDEFKSLSDDLIAKYSEIFRYPEEFYRDFNNNIIAVKIKK